MSPPHSQGAPRPALPPPVLCLQDKDLLASLWASLVRLQSLPYLTWPLYLPFFSDHPSTSQGGAAMPSPIILLLDSYTHPFLPWRVQSPHLDWSHGQLCRQSSFIL